MGIPSVEHSGTDKSLRIKPHHAALTQEIWEPTRGTGGEIADNPGSAHRHGKLRNPMNPDLLRGIGVFTEVARLKSVSRAAAALDLPKSTVSRRVSELEKQVGLRLLKRTTTKIELTDEAEFPYH